MGLRASTLHRLLGWRPGSHSRFAHDRGNRLPHDVVIVDETSMVSLSLMARLVEAVRPDARLVLVGDPGQLASIEAGVVLADIVWRPATAGVVVLEHVHRYGEGIARLAEAIRRGDGDATVAALRAAPGRDHVAADRMCTRPRPAWSWSATGRSRRDSRWRAAAREGAALEALAALGRFRLLCAHRRGPYGVERLDLARGQGWLAREIIESTSSSATTSAVRCW